MKIKVVAASNIASDAIAWWGNGWHGFSHAAALLPSGELLDARSDHVAGKPPGVQIRHDNYETWSRWAVIELAATAEQNGAWEQWLRKQIGRPYDSRGILNFLLGRRPTNDGMWFCSALQFEALRTVGLMPDVGVPAQGITPDGIAILTRAVGGRVIASCGI